MRMVQVRLKSENGECVTWIPSDKRIKRGTWLTLHKVDDKLFQVVDIYGVLDSHQLYTDWNNNI